MITPLKKYHEQVINQIVEIRKAICLELGISEATYYNIVNNEANRYLKCSPAEKEVFSKHYKIPVAELWPAKKRKKLTPVK